LISLVIDDVITGQACHRVAAADESIDATDEDEFHRLSPLSFPDVGQ